MKRFYFLQIPPVGAPKFVSVPGFRASLSSIYPLIHPRCDIVERVKVNLHGRPYIWLDENGFANVLPPNMLASRIFEGGRIVGTVLMEIGSFDLETADGLQRWSEKLAKWPREIEGLPFIPKEVE